MHRYLSVIKMCELFAGIPEDELTSVLHCLNAEVKSFKKGAWRALKLVNGWVAAIFHMDTPMIRS